MVSKFNNQVGKQNYIDYNRDRAIAELKEFCDFNYYEAKHLENQLTKFIQLYWFKEKWGVDKRRSHLSSLIVSGQITRDEAIKELEKPMYDEIEIQKDIDAVLFKLGMAKEEFEKIMNSPAKQHIDYPTNKIYSFVMGFINREKKRK